MMSCPAGFSTFRRSPFADMTETMVPGDEVQCFSQHVTWTDKHFRASQLDPLRQMGDDLADSALAALNVKPGQDALAVLREYTSRPIEDQPSDAPRKLLEHVMTVPDWVDWEQVKRGQEVYWKYIYYMGLIFLHYSLVAGFATPKFVKVLNSTGYMSGSRTKERVFDTNQFLLDILDTPKSLSPGFGNIGWESIVRVRFLHAGVRARLTKISRAHSKYYNIEEHGVPINQEDNIASLLALSSAIWMMMESRLGKSWKKSEKEDYLHVWRYVGHVIGVDDVLFAATTPELAEAGVDSLCMHMFDPDDRAGKLCTSFFEQLGSKSLIRLVLASLGLPDTIKLHVTFSEMFFGSTYWSATGLPTATREYRFMARLILYLVAFELWVTNQLPGWAQNIRRNVVYWTLVAVAVFESHTKRTYFSLKALPKDGEAKDLKDMVGETDYRLTADNNSWLPMLAAGTVAVGVLLTMSFVL
ncbi:hypothetical protein BG004_006488 [Podila humilis]|nr:hypothetical protein BG004_006488 [Podila humilis]